MTGGATTGHETVGVEATDAQATGAPAADLRPIAGPPDRLAAGAPVRVEGAAPSIVGADGSGPPHGPDPGGAVPAQVNAGTAPGHGDAVEIRASDVSSVEALDANPASRADLAAPAALDNWSTVDDQAGPGAVVGFVPAAEVGADGPVEHTAAGHSPVGASGAAHPDGLVAPRADLFPELTDAAVDDLVHQTAFATDAGVAFYVEGDTTRDFARAVEPTDGYVTVDLHGGRDGFYIDGHRLTPQQLARTLHELHAAGYFELPDGTGIKLLSCDTGFDGLESPAAALARELGLPVIAPDQVVWTSMEGQEIVSSVVAFGGYVIPKYPPDGAWHRFEPDGTEGRLDFDPGYHGPPVDGTRPLSQFDTADADQADHGYEDPWPEDPPDDRYERDPYYGNAPDFDDGWADRGAWPQRPLSGGRPGTPGSRTRA